MRSIWVGCQASLSRFSSVLESPATQSLARDHLAYYCDLVTDRQQRTYDIVREHHALTVARVNRRNPALADALRPVPNVGGWAWVYNTATTVRQGAKPDTDAQLFKAKLSLN